MKLNQRFFISNEISLIFSIKVKKNSRTYRTVVVQLFRMTSCFTSFGLFSFYFVVIRVLVNFCIGKAMIISTGITSTVCSSYPTLLLQFQVKLNFVLSTYDFTVANLLSGEYSGGWISAYSLVFRSYSLTHKSLISTVVIAFTVVLSV